MVILPNDTILRAGKGEASVWDIDRLPTHGPNGKKRIGDLINPYETRRDDPENIERSSGSLSSSRITFVDQPTLAPGIWLSLPQAPATMICSTHYEGAKVNDGPEYGCVSIDLEHGGKRVARYVGHGGAMFDFSVSGADPNVFLSGCSDGFARLCDVRRPLPVCTFDAGTGQEFASSVALAHPDGIPTVFTGTRKAQHVKVWDVRARAAVYELETGNNRVTSLAWDAS